MPSNAPTGFFLADSGEIFSGFGGTGGHYAPSTYLVTATDGSVVDLDVNRGLLSVTDRFGQGLLFTDDGIEATDGPELGFDSDVEGRITTPTLPGRATVVYTHLTMRADISGKTARFSLASRIDAVKTVRCFDRCRKRRSTSFNFA